MKTEKKHYWMVAGMMHMQELKTKNIGQCFKNMIVATEQQHFTVADMQKGQTGLMQQAADMAGVDVDFIDLNLYSISYLGHMTPLEFHGPQPEAEDVAPATIQ